MHKAQPLVLNTETTVRRCKFGHCVLCQRETALTFHHLIPKKLHRRKHFQKHFTRCDLNRGINICRKCHNGLHRLFDEMTLGRELNTLQRLGDNTQVRKHCAWVRRQKN